MKAFIIVMLLPVISVAQYHIRGKVLDAKTRQPLEGVTVFLNNTTIGTTSNKGGEFELSNIKPGRYELIVSSLNYEQYTSATQPGENNELMIVSLNPSANVLQDVVVEPYDKNGWEKWGDSFHDYFIGSSQLAKHCILKNPDAVKFKYNGNTNNLKVFSNEKLIFENTDAGYRIIYLLSKFDIDYNSGIFSFKGYPLFEELKPKNEKENARWLKTRHDMFDGSLRQFIRSLYFNQLAKNGFEIRKEKLITVEEKARIKNILRQLNKENKTAGNDSIAYYSQVKNLGPDENMVILNPVIAADSIVFADAARGSLAKALYFQGGLQVRFLKKRIPAEYAKILPAYRRNEFIQNEITLRFNKPVYILANGNYYDGLDLSIDGYWSWYEKVATMLPIDYIDKN